MTDLKHVLLLLVLLMTISTAEKAQLYGHKLERQILPLQQLSGKVVLLKPNYNTLEIKDGVTNGVDINQKYLNRHIVKSQHSNDDGFVEYQNQQNGLAIDWPGTNGDHPHSFVLDNYLNQHPSQLLVHLDTIPDYVVVPRELFHLTSSKPDLANLDSKWEAVPLSDNMISSLSKQNIEVPEQQIKLNSEPVVQENNFSNQIPSERESFTNILKNIETTNNELRRNNMDMMEVSNVVNSNISPTNENIKLAKDTGSNQHVPARFRASALKIRPGHEALSHESKTSSTGDKQILFSSQPLRILSAEVASAGNIGPNRSENVNNVQTNSPALQTQKRQGRELNLAAKQQAREMPVMRLPPLSDIFGGESLYKPRRRVITLFNMSSKQEALRNFKG